MSADRPTLLTAKVDKLAAIIIDAEPGKGANPEAMRQHQSDAAREVRHAESVADVENVPLPSERG